MCPPVIMALQVASVIGSVAAAQSAADAQSSANKRQYENTMRAYRENIAQTNLEHGQEREASMQKLNENDIAARAGMATATVAAGESGVTGMSVDHLMMGLSGKQNRYNSAVTTNYDRVEGALNNQRDNVYANAASTINGLKTPATPDYLGSALRIGEVGVAADKKYNGGKLFG